MQRFNFDSFISKYEDRTQGHFDVVAQLHDSQVINPNLAKVLVTFNTEETTREKNFYAIASLFCGNAAPIECSFRRLPISSAFAAVGFIRKNTEVRSLDTASLKKYRVMAGNLLLDENDNSLWELKGDQNSRYIARQSDENLADLIQHAGVIRHNGMGGVVNLASLVTDVRQRGEFIGYISPNTLEYASGLLLNETPAGMEIYDPVDDETEITPVDTLVESSFIDWKSIAREADIRTPKSAYASISGSPVSASTKSELKNYYKEVYSYNPEYLQKIYEIIDQTNLA